MLFYLLPQKKPSWKGSLRGSPSMAKGVGLRLLSRRGSWVQIPPPAPFPLFQSFVGKLHLRTGIPSLISIFSNNLCENAPFCCAILFACCEIEYHSNLGRLGSSVFERCCSSKSVLNALLKKERTIQREPRYFGLFSRFCVVFLLFLLVFAR